jgi:hypothetical protein
MKNTGTKSAARRPNPARKWTEVFRPTREKQHFLLKGSRRLCCHASCFCEENPDWLHTVRALKEAGVVEDSSETSSPINATSYVFTYSFLGGKFTTVGGNYWGLHGIVWVATVIEPRKPRNENDMRH